MKKQKLNSNSLGLSLAIISAIGILLTWIAGNIGIYSEFVKNMSEMHLLFSLNLIGLVGGIVEASIFSFIIGWLIAYFYNKF